MTCGIHAPNDSQAETRPVGSSALNPQPELREMDILSRSGERHRTGAGRLAEATAGG